MIFTLSTLALKNNISLTICLEKYQIIVYLDFVLIVESVGSLKETEL